MKKLLGVIQETAVATPNFSQHVGDYLELSLYEDIIYGDKINL